MFSSGTDTNEVPSSTPDNVAVVLKDRLTTRGVRVYDTLQFRFRSTMLLHLWSISPTRRSSASRQWASCHRCHP
ncbi:hypothetical protein L596_000883 [Steinernema carpocapsae]|uniref:Uncharacterized protein n=1 Tax=Steinernema carpocapsae TaxID=34508 RepID=A0A4U8ULW0_STECR|nr:hypothetical protein L596_000876 [Steinernema carpocapsae]TMS33107.1 hypothetical protein L596_000883 [Steinernema carpocapsae]